LLDDEDAWLRIPGHIAWCVARELGLIDAACSTARLAPLLQQEFEHRTAATRSMAIASALCFFLAPGRLKRHG
jgi:hypothetical protein